MRVLLANMPVKFNKRENLEPPLGILYLGTMLEQNGHKVFLKDYEIEDFSKEELIRFIKKEDIKLVGVSFRTASYMSARTFVNGLAEIRNRIFIVAGGHHATAFPKRAILDLLCDVVVRGEGEYTIIELVNALQNDKTLSDIKGITYRNREEIIDNEDRPPIVNLDELPLPARNLLSYDSYTVSTIITSRGCPFKCIYCDKGVSTRQVKFRSPENIYSEIVEISKNYNEKKIYFVDDHFFLAKVRLNKVFDLIEKNNLRFNWICQARADEVDFEMLKRAKKLGCELIMYGVESGDPEELKYMNKETTVEQARTALLLTKKAGIRVRANFMLGFPISTHKTIRNTIRFAKSVPLEVVRFFSVTPLPNTELWDRVYGKDIDLGEIDWNKFDFYTPNYSTSELSREDILNYVGVAYIHTLTKKSLIELSFTFLPRFIRFLYLVFKKRRVRGNISMAFPSTVNLFLDLKLIVPPGSLYKKIQFLVNILRLKNKLFNGK